MTRRLLVFILMLLIAGWSPQVAGAQDEAGQAGGQAGEQAGDDAANDANAPPAEPPPPPPVPPDFDSPRSTMMTFLEALNEPYDMPRAVECLDLSIEGTATSEYNAAKLFGIINRIEYVNPDELPSAEEIETDPEFAEYTFFPRFPDHFHLFTSGDVGGGSIELVRMGDGSWRFSAETVAGIPALWDKFEGFEPISGTTDVTELSWSLWISSQLPDSLKEEFLSLKVWQWMGLLLLILLGVALDFIVRVIVGLIARRVIHRQGAKAERETLRRMVRPFGLATAAIFWVYTVDLLGLPADALKVILPAIRLFVMLAGVWAAFRLTDLLGEVVASKAASTETKFDDLLVPLVRKTVKIFIAIFGMIYIANSLDIALAPLLTGLGIGGVGFAFAAKDTLENFFGSFTVITDRPFEVGDWIVIGDVEGTVEEVGFRSTRVRTFYNSLVTVPNANLVRATVDNFGRRKYRRFKTHIGITYDTPPDRIESFCEGIRELIRLHPYTRKDYFLVWLHAFGPSSLDVLVYMFHEVPDWQTELRERQRLMLDIMRLADRLNVEFAFPTQTLQVQQIDPTAEHTPAASPGSRADRTARAEGRRAVADLTADADWRRRLPPPHRIRGSADADPDDETQIESKVGGDG